jgi:acetyltransferase-like isoleucine patch superfamily enzyme
MTSMSQVPTPSNPFDPGYYHSDELRAFGFADVGRDVSIAKNATIIGLHNIVIGDHVRIDGNTTIAAHAGSLVIGRHVHIGGGSFLACAGGITLDDFSGLSQGVRIYSGSDDYSGEALTNPTVPRAYLNLRIAPVALGRHVIVGSGSVILPGVRLHDGVAVGALSLVAKSLDAWGVYAGTPARRIRERSNKLLALEQALLAQERGQP